MGRFRLLAGVALLLVCLAADRGLAQVGQAQTYHASTTTCTTVEKMLVDGNALRIGLRILNVGSETVYVGGRDIAPARSWPIHAGVVFAGHSHAFVLMGPEASGGLYCVADGSATVKIFQILR